MLFALLLLPLLLPKALVGGLLMLLVLPVVAVAAIAGVIAFALALIVPLLPVAFMCLVIWFVIRAAQRPVMAR